MTIGEGASVAAVVATVLTYCVTAWREIDRKKRDQRIDAYLELSSGMSEVNVWDLDTEQNNLARAKILDARHKIVLFGDEKVIAACAVYFSTRGNHYEEPQRTNYVRLIQAMQQDAVKRETSGKAILSILVDQPGTPQNE